MRRVVLGVVMAAVMLSGSRAAAQSCIIELQNPDPRGERSVSLFPTLKWSAGGDGVYDVYLATEKESEGDCDRIENPYAKELRETSLDIKDPLQPGTTYFWKVGGGANALCRDGVSSACGTFTTAECPSAPTLIKPASSTVTFGNIDFEWSAVPNAIAYRLHISIDGGQFTNDLVAGTTKTKTLAMGQTIDWKVEAVGIAGCPEAMSATSRFTTTCPDAVPTLLQPSPGTIVPERTSVTFKWTSVFVAGALYTLEVTSDGGATWNALATNISTNEFTTTMSSTGDYDWRVIVNYENACADRTSATSQFYVGCPTIAPELVGPADGTESGNPITFTWKPVEGGISYLLNLVNSKNEQVVLTTTQTTFTATAIPADTYDWYVEVSRGTACPHVASDKRKLIVKSNCSNEKAILVSPANGASNQVNDVRFEWKPVTGAIGYKLILIVDGSSPLTVETTDTNATQTIKGSAVQWKVEALLERCPATSSDIFSFTMKSDCPSGTPALVTPADGAANVENDVKFEWSAVPDATSYKLILSVDGATPFTAVETKETFATYTIKGNAALWKVEAVFAGTCPARSSAFFRFTMKLPCPTGVATPVTPSNGASNVESPVKFEWKPADGSVTKYRLIVSVDGGTPFAAATTTDTTATISLSGATVLWKVETYFGDTCFTESQHFPFTLFQKPVCPDATPATLLSPTNGAKGLSSPVTFKWEAVKGATGYRLIYGGSAGQTTLGATKETTLDADVPAGDGYWLVQTFFGDDCPSSLSDRFSINVAEGAKCSEEAPRLISPANGATNVATTVKFQWHPVADAVKYMLFVSTGGGFDSYGTTDETSLEARVPVGTVRWLVAAIFASCPETRSEVSSFTAGEEVKCPEGTASLTSPRENESVTSPVRLLWTAVDKAVGYRVWFAQGLNAPAIIEKTILNEALVNLPAGDGTWSIEAVFADGCPSTRSSEGHFTVKEATNCGNNAAPRLVSPVGTEAAPAAVTSPVTLDWDASTGAVGYRAWLSVNGQAFEDLGITKETSLIRTLGPGKYAWYTQAFFDNCQPLASDKAYFTIEDTKPRCSTEAPSIVAPAEGATVQSPVTISWSDVADAVKYRVFAIINGGEPVLLGTTTETNIVRPLPPGTIIVTVEAVFNECPSTFSPRVTFKVEEAQNCSDAKAQLVAPANNSTQDGEVTLMWEPVSGAIRYVVVGRLGDGAATPIADTTDTSVTRKPPPGRFEWWVLTFFRGCDATESEHFFFNVPAVENCNNRTPITLLPKVQSKVDSPVHFSWTPVPNAIGYQVWAAQGSNAPSVIAATAEPNAKVELEPGLYHWYVVAQFATNCPGTESAPAEFEVVAPPPCGTPEAPQMNVVGQALANTEYVVRWTPLPNVDAYELQESTNINFENAQSFTVGGPFRAFSHDVSAVTQYFYRVRGISNCNDTAGPFSGRVGVFVVPVLGKTGSAELGTGKPIIQKVFLQGSSAPIGFKARTNRPWAKVTPAEGTLPVAGMELTITIDESTIGIGTNTFTLIVEYTGGSAGKLQANGPGATLFTPISVTLATPVTPTGKGTPPPDALIFGAVGHAPGQNNSLFESDVRITNLSAQTMKYQVNFTPSGTDGTVTGNSTTIEIGPNKTTALDDIMTSFFGTAPNGAAIGMLEVRPLTTSTSSGGFFSSVSAATQQALTLGSSRTYNFTPNGTFGQFIPATPFSKFVGTGKTLLLQQVAQSTAYRANFGFLEASGQPVTLDARVFDASNNLLATIPISLKAGEHQQQNLMLALNGIGDLPDGRVEVEVKSGTGKVTAYVSEVDNVTNDPLLVSAVEKSTSGANRYIVPGMAHKDLGFAFWVSDVRVFNAGSTPQNATLTFYTEGNPSQFTSKQVTINPGEIKVLDDIVQNFFAQPNGAGGSLVITTPSNSQLIPTARTYNKAGTGTYGQYIPGVTVADSVGLGDPALQILQVENSTRMRTNIGLNETTGKPVTVEVAVILPDSIVTPFITVPLQANEYKQIGLVNFNLGDDIYNARVTVKVVNGTGRVTSYGSMIDALTQDPTYVPPQK